MRIAEFEKRLRANWKDIPHAVLADSDPYVVEKVRMLNQLNFTLKRMATTHIGLLINTACSFLDKDEAYVNIGVWNGFTFFSGVLGNENVPAIANDWFKVYTGNTGYTGGPDKLGRQFGNTEEIFKTEFARVCKSPNQKFFVEDCWQFLAKYEERKLPKIGFYLYDGDHSHESQVRALEEAYPYLAENCVVMIDDCNDPAVRTANEAFFSKRKEFRKIFEVFTPANGWPTWWNGVELYARGK